jgi:glycosyltransferase involved in cell wall biosynthesis
MKNFTPLTIAIPTYERCKSVISLVNSIIPQLKNEDELLVVDDGSKDGTSNALREIKEVTLISNSSNIGMVRNWNKCLTSAKNDWICIIHDDDIISPNALDTIRRACLLYPEPFIIGHNYSGDNIDFSFRCNFVESGTWSALHPFLIPSGVTIHKVIIENIGLFDENFKYSADIEFFSRVCSRYTSICIENPRIITFNLHGENYEYKTWGKPDFLTQMEQIEEKIIAYSGLSEDNASNYFRNKMNGYVDYMLKNAFKANDNNLVRKIGISSKNKTYLRKKIRIIAHVAAFLNWVPNF